MEGILGKDLRVDRSSLSDRYLIERLKATGKAINSERYQITISIVAWEAQLGRRIKTSTQPGNIFDSKEKGIRWRSLQGRRIHHS